MSDNKNHNKSNKKRNNKNHSHRGSKHNNRKGNYRRKNRNRRPKSLTPSRIMQKYDNLMEQHIIARRKYFEIYGRITGKQFEKVKNNFNKTLKAIIDYQNSLKGWQKEVLDKKLNFYPEDRQFSQSHELEPIGEEVSFEGDFDDPHLLETQKNHQWSEDTEESMGTIEDYKAYKGIVD